MPTVVLGVTGCIGAYKACEVLRELQKHGLDVRVVMTASAARFVTPLTFEALSRHPVFVDQLELGDGGEIQHVSLADAADLLLVAPATANTLAKFARGLADDALSTLYTATRAPVVIAPAMNVNMFTSPAVVENLATLRGWNLSDAELSLQGVHPDFGEVTLRQLLATWVAHDLGHLAQIARVLAKRYRDEVGPWRAYLPILDR